MSLALVATMQTPVRGEDDCTFYQGRRWCPSDDDEYEYEYSDCGEQARQWGGLVKPYCSPPDDYDHLVEDSWDEGDRSCRLGDKRCAYTGPSRCLQQLSLSFDSGTRTMRGTSQGRCITSYPNGLWTLHFGLERETEDKKYTSDPDFVATGRYKKGKPLGAHVIKYQNTVVSAACYELERDPDPDLRHWQAGVTQFVPNELWSFELYKLIPEKPEAPVLEDFISIEKPIPELPDKPSRSDYHDAIDFNEAMKDYTYELNEAKKAFKDELLRYKEARRPEIATAKQSLREAKAEYRTELTEYTQGMKQLKRRSKFLARLANRCPKLTKDMCRIDGWCQEQGLCTLDSEGYCVASASGCKASTHCKEKGTCSLEADECVAASDADCLASKVCKDNGKCVMRDGECHPPLEDAPNRGPSGKGFVRIEPGTFTMGPASFEESRYDKEGPTHRVTISRAFSLQATEVTQDQWKVLMGTAPSEFSSCGKSCPVERVSWWDAVAYTNALSKRDGLPACYRLTGCSGDGSYTCSGVKVTAPGGKPTACTGYRLPTEAEWEYAARAGTKGARYGELSRVAWYKDNAGPKTHPVGKKQANAWGLYDMLGNVWEWTWDWTESYSSGSSTDPVGASSGSLRVFRGCSWVSAARYCRAAYRNGHTPEYRGGSLGFRPARSLP
jgi:formylglycine-generating enzyme required for sulfatase activity